MEVKVDLSPLLKALTETLSPDEASAIIKGVTGEVYLESRQRALKLGRNLGPRIARSLRTTVNGLAGEVLASGADGYVGLHVHQGGPIRSRNGKVLAIPTRWNNNKDKFASDRSDLQLIKSKKRNRCYLFKKLTSPGEVLGRPLYVLTPQTRPQRPRPWWPDSKDLDALTEKFIRENL